MGMPGAISPATGLVKNANSTWLIGQAFDKDLQKALNRPLRVENDANCLAVSEATDGAAAGASAGSGGHHGHCSPAAPPTGHAARQKGPVAQSN